MMYRPPYLCAVLVTQENSSSLDPGQEMVLSLANHISPLAQMLHLHFTIYMYVICYIMLYVLVNNNNTLRHIYILK